MFYSLKVLVSVLNSLQSIDIIPETLIPVWLAFKTKKFHILKVTSSSDKSELESLEVNFYNKINDFKSKFKTRHFELDLIVDFYNFLLTETEEEISPTRNFTPSLLNLKKLGKRSKSG